jgi:hypothetical protein
MKNEVVKTSKAIKGVTSQVRSHLDAFEHAGDIYLAGMKRLEAEYVERIKKATELLTGVPAPQVNGEAPPAQAAE